MIKKRRRDDEVPVQAMDAEQEDDVANLDDIADLLPYGENLQVRCTSLLKKLQHPKVFEQFCARFERGNERDYSAPPPFMYS